MFLPYPQKRRLKRGHPAYTDQASRRPASLEDFYRRLWAGEVNLAEKDQQIRCGLVHWNTLLHDPSPATLR
jgi:hypothetical protein